MIFELSTHAANLLRLAAISEISFVIGFLLLRLWQRRWHPTDYMFLMTISLILFAAYTAITIALRYGEPLTWWTPYGLGAATLTLVAVIREGRAR